MLIQLTLTPLIVPDPIDCYSIDSDPIDCALIVTPLIVLAPLIVNPLIGKSRERVENPARASRACIEHVAHEMVLVEPNYRAKL